MASAHIAAMAEAAMRPTVRDLMARKLLAENAVRAAGNDDYREASDADVAAQNALMERLADLTGLTRLELRELGGLIW